MEIVLKENFLVSLYSFFNFTFSVKYTEKVKVKKCLPLKKRTTISGRGFARHVETEALCLFVETTRGELFIEVSQKNYNRYQINDEISVQYQVGRIDGELTGVLLD